MKKLIKKIDKKILLLVLSFIIVVAVVFSLDRTLEKILFAALSFILLLGYIFFISANKLKDKYVYSVLSNIKNGQRPLVIGDDIPTALIDKGNKICWFNHAFASIVDISPMGEDIYMLLPDLAQPNKEKQVTINDTVYTKNLTEHEFKRRKFKLLRLLDKENEEDIKRAYLGHMGAVCYVQIDNVDEISTDITLSERSALFNEIDKIINDFTKMLNGICFKFDRDKYIIFFERRYLNVVLSRRFGILQEARNYKINGFNVTLSLAIGVADTLNQANESAVKALELAQGRGGDQAVVKQYDKYNFFGGLQKGIEKRSKVKIRQFSRSFRNLMEQAGDIFIMGHTVPDLDSFGSALGILSCARKVNKKAYIVLSRPTKTISNLISVMKGEKEYNGVIITEDEAEQIIKPTSMIVILDTQIRNHLEAPDLLDRTDLIVIIDHHFRGTDFISDATLFLHEPYASSTCEMVTEMIQYFDEKPVLLPFEAEALLAGITLDTKSFSFKTGARTFEAASFLRRVGADAKNIKQFFQDDLETFSMRAEVVRHASILSPGIAIATVPPNTENAAVIAPQAADSLLTIRGVIASFVISSIDGNVLISGRSLGSINAQIILEKIGGGGQTTVAGARIKNVDIKTATKMLKKAIDEYMAEGKVEQ
ncbi:MAG: DHH family phosphoesterase [Eubacteriales bacterium]